MRDGARLAAAIGVIAEIEDRHRPARLALKAWGDGAHYAGAKDRAFVAGLTLDVLRRRRSLAWRMEDGGPRAAGLGALAFLWGWPPERIASAAEEAAHGPGPLTGAERWRLEGPVPLAEAPAAVGGDYPDWLEPHFVRAFGEARAAHGEALASRAPVDVRVNTLKTDLARVLKALAPFHPQAIDALPTAVRIAAPPAAQRAAPVEATGAFEKGWFEIQDLASQIAAAAAGDIAGAQVLDLCAGGGGKTLALAAGMANRGQIFAYDRDPRRLAETVRRARRAGVRNLQVREPRSEAPLADLQGRMDVVFIDAPCTGTGTWRRHPDAKWRLTLAQLEARIGEQDDLLAAAAAYPKVGGRMVYVTCSFLCEENEDRVAAFLATHPGFRSTGAARRLTPLVDATDGFFIQALERV